MTNLTFTEKILNVISPKAALNRVTNRVKMEMVSSVAHTGASNTKKALKSFVPSFGSSDEEDLPDLENLVARSRDLYRNAPYARGAININTNNVIGSGLRMQSQIDGEYLGLSDEEKSAWERNTEREYKNFSESRMVDACGIQNIYGLEELAFKSVLLSGEVLALFPFKKRTGRKYDLTVQLIEGDWLGSYFDFGVQKNIIAGVEIDGYGEPIAYHIQKKQPGIFVPKTETVRVNRFGKKTGRTNIVHLYMLDRPSQKRGIPYLAPVIELFKQLTRYQESEIMASVLQSMLTAFVTSDIGDKNLNLPGSEEASRQGDDEVALGSGSMFALNPGERIEVVKGERANAQFGAFIDSFISSAGSGLSIPHEVLSQKFQSSYSAARASLLQAWSFFRVRRSWFIDSFCRPFYHEFLDEAIMKGYIKAPGYFQSKDIQAAYRKSQWIGQGMGQIDPVKDTNGAILRMANGLSTGANEAATMNGTDYEMNIEARSKEIKKAKELGVYVEPTILKTNEEEETDDNE